MEPCARKKRICFFDSGIGGLSLLLKSVRVLPCADYFYFADNGRVPYGNLSPERITALADAAFARMARLDPDAAVIACNTVTAVSAAYLRQKYPFPIVGIQPAVKPAAEGGKSVAVLATPATAKSAAVASLVEKFGGGSTEVVACPKLAAYIEQNVLDLSAREVEALLPKISADGVVLGCTHYAFIENIIREHYKLPVFDGLDGTVNRLRSVLGKIDHRGGERGKIIFVGGDPSRNFRVFRRFSGQNMP